MPSSDAPPSTLQPIEIHEIAPNDLSAMLQIWNENYLVLTSTYKKHTSESLDQWYRARSDDNHEYFGLYVANTLRGFSILKYEEEKLMVKMTAMESPFQNQGLGSLLIKFAAEEAEILGIPLFSEVKVENFRAVNFFIRNEFSIIEYSRQWNEYLLKLKRTFVMDN